MRIILLRAVAMLVLAAALAGFAISGRADDEAARARAVIGAQEQAFGRDDAVEAFSYAAPGVVNLFHTPDVFMDVVRRSYAPVYRHRSFVFGQARDLGETTVSQNVAIQDDSGTDWTAEYTLERQADGTWRITGCRLTKAPGISA